MLTTTLWTLLSFRVPCVFLEPLHENARLISVLQVIKEPMDLSLIRERIMSGALMSLDDMSRDLFVMCNNAMVFNGKGDPYFDYSKVRSARVRAATPFPLRSQLRLDCLFFTVVCNRMLPRHLLTKLPLRPLRRYRV